MKIRTGFVSNSSSSSFVCDVCNNAYEGWDGDYGGVTEYTCENYHSMCSECTDFKGIGFENLVKYYEKFKDDFAHDEYIKEVEEAIKKKDSDELEILLIDEGDIDYYDLPEELCPCCNFKHIANKDIEAYLLASVGKNWNMIREEIKKKFNNYDQFKEFKKNIP